MNYIAQKRPVYILLSMVLLFLLPRCGLGVVLHPDGEPNLITWTDRPDSNVVGRWRTNGSCVAVSSDCVLAVRHTLGGVDSTVTIGGEPYIVDEVWEHSTADLRIAKLNGANLSHFVDIYDDVNEVGKEVVMGGYGWVRDAELKTGGVTYGYDWKNTAYDNLRFGTNKVNSTQNNSYLGGYTSDIVKADFDDIGYGSSTNYECSIAYYDSGGGWFINDGGYWEVAGLSRGVEHTDQTWFRRASDPNILDPDRFDAVRVSSYATWINETIPPRMPGELTGDGVIDFNDFGFFASYWLNTDCNYPDWCQGCDFEPDGDVDFADFAAFGNCWFTDDSESPPPKILIPVVAAELVNQECYNISQNGQTKELK